METSQGSLTTDEVQKQNAVRWGFVARIGKQAIFSGGHEAGDPVD